jgi:hypothetical protein
MSTQLVGGGTSTLDALSVAGALTVGGNPLDATFQQLVNNTGASSDITLAIGQLAYVDVSAATTAALKITTGDNQLYEMTLIMNAATGSAGVTILKPNNATNTNFFISHTIQEVGTVGAGSAGVGAVQQYRDGFVLSDGIEVGFCSAKISTKTTSKRTTYVNEGTQSNAASGFTTGSSKWVATASTQTTPDTTTAWTSLGTVTFPVAATGRIYIRRLA